MNINNIQQVYFVGIGGIGMSAIARYFAAKGVAVAGYDRTPGPVTDALQAEGIAITFTDSVESIPPAMRAPSPQTLVVYTPAVPKKHQQLNFFTSNAFEVRKRAEVLGLLFNSANGIGVAGTHGKTTVSTMTAHLLHSSVVGCNAFLGGISQNYGTNLILNPASDYIVAEADEFDRSFLRLFPQIAVITSADADHLDIYGQKENLTEAFGLFAAQVKQGGVLIVKKGIDVPLSEALKQKAAIYTYSGGEEADYYATNVRIERGFYTFDLVTPATTIEQITLGVPCRINVENAVAAASAALQAGISAGEIRAAFAAFKGVWRRFDFQTAKDAPRVYIDDYAHHPEELKAIIGSVREMYPERKLCGVFQPHLFTRTRDFVDGFAQSLDMLDRIILLDIYPAREEPIEGITSKIIFDRIKTADKLMCTKDELMDTLKNSEIDVLLTLGAGDIDRFVNPIKELVNRGQ